MSDAPLDAARTTPTPATAPAATANGSAAKGAADRAPDEIRKDIERTREELGQTLDALSTAVHTKAKKTVPIVIGGVAALFALMVLRTRLKARKKH